MKSKQEQRPANTGFASGGVTYHLELCASIQVQCRLTVLCSETRPNAKPENVVVSNPLRSLLTMARRLTSLAVSRRFADCLQQATWLNSSAFVSSIQLRYFANSPSHYGPFLNDNANRYRQTNEFT